MTIENTVTTVETTEDATIITEPVRVRARKGFKTTTDLFTSKPGDLFVLLADKQRELWEVISRDTSPGRGSVTKVVAKKVREELPMVLEGALLGIVAEKVQKALTSDVRSAQASE